MSPSRAKQRGKKTGSQNVSVCTSCLPCDARVYARRDGDRTIFNGAGRQRTWKNGKAHAIIGGDCRKFSKDDSIFNCLNVKYYEKLAWWWCIDVCDEHFDDC